MNKDTTIKKESVSIHKHLVRIQQELKAPKGQLNKFANFRYRSCEDIVEAVKPLLKECTLVITDEVQQVGDRYYIKATAVLSNGTQFLEASAVAREPQEKKGMDEAQVTGATSSYARKYALNGLFAIDDTRDADTMDNTKTENEEQKNDDGLVHEPVEGIKCEICGLSAIEREGITKGGKKYHGIFCSSGDKSHTRWLWN